MRAPRRARAVALALATMFVFLGATECQPGHGSRGSLQRYAYNQLDDHGWARAEFGCLKKLWNHESGWRPAADNPTSSAYGIPQAMTDGAADKFRGRPAAERKYRRSARYQIRWGLRYIDRRYGSPCDAWGFWQNPTTGDPSWGNWYAPAPTSAPVTTGEDIT